MESILLENNIFDQDALESFTNSLGGLPGTPKIGADTTMDKIKSASMEPNEILITSFINQENETPNYINKEDKLNYDLPMNVKFSQLNEPLNNSNTGSPIINTAKLLGENNSDEKKNVPFQLSQPTLYAGAHDGPLSAVLEEEDPKSNTLKSQKAIVSNASTTATSTSIPIQMHNSPLLSNQGSPSLNAMAAPSNRQPYQTPEQYRYLMEMRMFLASAPNQPWGAEENIKRMQLPNKEFISCILWNGLYHITGTDIVRILLFRFESFGRPIVNLKKFEEGIFSDLRNLKPGIDAVLEVPRSPFLELLYKNQCIRTQKKQKVFFWFSVSHDRLFLDALERDLRRESSNQEATTRPNFTMSVNETMELAKRQCALLDLNQYPASPPASVIEPPAQMEWMQQQQSQSINSSPFTNHAEFTPTTMGFVNMPQGIPMSRTTSAPSYNMFANRPQMTRSASIGQFSDNGLGYFDGSLNMASNISPALSHQQIPGNASPSLSVISDADTLIQRMAEGFNITNSPYASNLSLPGTPNMNAGVYQDGNRFKNNRRRAHSMSQPYHRRASSTEQLMMMGSSFF